MKAMKEINDIEAAMELEASEGVHEDYENALPDFKLTFEAAYAQHAEEADDTAPRVVDCMDVLLAIEKDATAAFPSEAVETASAAETASPTTTPTITAAAATEAAAAAASPAEAAAAASPAAAAAAAEATAAAAAAEATAAAAEVK